MPKCIARVGSGVALLAHAFVLVRFLVSCIVAQCCCAFKMYVTVDDRRNSCVVELIWHNGLHALSPPCVSTGFHADTAQFAAGPEAWFPALMANSRKVIVVSAVPALMAGSAIAVVSADPALMAGS